jgi:hypothetical protein
MGDQTSTYHLPPKLICSVLKLPKDPHLEHKHEKLQNTVRQHSAMGIIKGIQIYGHA